MKKNKKIQLNRETVRILTDGMAGKVLGGNLCSSNAPTGPNQACQGTNNCASNTCNVGCQVGGTIGGTVGGGTLATAGC